MISNDGTRFWTVNGFFRHCAAFFEKYVFRFKKSQYRVFVILTFKKLRKSFFSTLKGPHLKFSVVSVDKKYRSATAVIVWKSLNSSHNDHIEQVTLVFIADIIFGPHIMGEENHNLCCVLFFTNFAKTPLYYSI